jgi:hypothetical protein
MTSEKIGHPSRLLTSAVAIMALVVGMFAITVSTATAQTRGACDQYRPNCDDNKDDNDQGDDDQGDEGADENRDDAVSPALGGGDGDADGGNLPFTGYPLTSAVALFLGLLLLGCGLRAALAVRDRLNTGNQTPS